jgi:hypothetical protein
MALIFGIKNIKRFQRFLQRKKPPINIGGFQLPANYLIGNCGNSGKSAPADIALEPIESPVCMMLKNIRRVFINAWYTSGTR